MIASKDELERKLADYKAMLPEAKRKLAAAEALPRNEQDDMEDFLIVLQKVKARQEFESLHAAIDELSMRIMAYPKSPDGEPLSVKYLVGQCPVQAAGYLDGVPFYFRARGTHWRLYIGEDPVVNDECLYAEEYYGEWPSAGWMSHDEALAILRREYEKWHAGREMLQSAPCWCDFTPDFMADGRNQSPMQTREGDAFAEPSPDDAAGGLQRPGA